MFISAELPSTPRQLLGVPRLLAAGWTGGERAGVRGRGGGQQRHPPPLRRHHLQRVQAGQARGRG